MRTSAIVVIAYVLGGLHSAGAAVAPNAQSLLAAYVKGLGYDSLEQSCEAVAEYFQNGMLSPRLLHKAPSQVYDRLFEKLGCVARSADSFRALIFRIAARLPEPWQRYIRQCVEEDIKEQENADPVWFALHAGIDAGEFG